MKFRDLALTNEEEFLQHWIPRLYVAVSQGIDELGRSVLQEWIDSGEEKKLRAVAALASEADWRFCLDQHEFAVGLLQRADEAGPEVLDNWPGGAVFECEHPRRHRSRGRTDAARR